MPDLNETDLNETDLNRIDLNLPDPIAAYFDADARDGEAVALCFTKEAVVKDEGQTHRGRAAIRAWKSEASAKYTYTSELLDVEQQNDQHIVRSRLIGNFPGSPVVLRFAFRLERGKIASLEIAP